MLVRSYVEPFHDQGLARERRRKMVMMMTPPPYRRPPPQARRQHLEAANPTEQSKCSLQ